jgi:hypothetical protein
MNVSFGGGAVGLLRENWQFPVRTGIGGKNS